MVPGSISEERYNIKQLLGRPIIRAICTSACALSFVSTAFDVIFVLFCYSSVEHGGLGLSVRPALYILLVLRTEWWSATRDWVRVGSFRYGSGAVVCSGNAKDPRAV